MSVGRSLIIGVIILAILTFFSTMLQDLMKLAGIVGLIFWGLSAIFSGVLGSGDRIRANFSSESKEDRNRRWKWGNICFLIGLPNIIASVAIYIILFT